MVPYDINELETIKRTLPLNSLLHNAQYSIMDRWELRLYDFQNENKKDVQLET